VEVDQNHATPYSTRHPDYNSVIDWEENITTDNCTINQE